MKTYCKPMYCNIENQYMHRSAICDAIRKKLGRKDFQRLIVNTGKITPQEYAQELLEGRWTKISEAVDALAQEYTQRIIDRDLRLKPIRQFQREDGLTHKVRDICQESPEQQIMEYMAVEALMPLFRAKLLPIQYGSVPKRGQVRGKQKIERILRKQHKEKLEAVKSDIKKAYPSVTVNCVMELLERDIGKNKTLLWFLRALMSNYPGRHLCIGGYLSAWLFNYVMSYVLRYMLSQYQERRGKKKRLVAAVVCYADDSIIFGRASQLKKVMKKTSQWAERELGLKIKNAWQLTRISDFAAEKANNAERKAGSRKRTQGVDMMGYVVRRTHTIIRGRVFLRMRRQLLRAAQDIAIRGTIPWWRAVKLTAYKGWMKYSDSTALRIKYKTAALFGIARRSASRHGKEIINEKRNLLIIAAGG